MLTIRDHKNNEYPLLAVKTVTEDLNSNPVLELKIPKRNNLDLKLIDKLWEINYQTVDYKIMYVKQVTKGDSFYLDVRAIPLFYWDFDKLIVHENKDGHYTGVNAFTDLFNGTGYQYVLVDFVEAIQIEGYGKGETRLEMFKRLIERFGLEFYIVGKTVYLKKLIGNDTNFQYRYKLNASNVSKSIDASNYFTHIKGFGNFDEGSEDYLKDAKLKREFTSPLASVLGIYEGKPIVDGRIKDNATMDSNLKRAVEESLEISIEGNLHDVRSIYAEAVPTIGDRVFLIDERIGLEQEIRIHTLKRTYDVNDKLIDCEVTFGSQNIRDRYKSNLNSAAKGFTALMKGNIKLPTWSLDEIARGMITKIHASENELRYGDFGIQAIDKNNPNNVFGLNSQGWYISTDGGATARTIATADGILAESIIGNHLIGLQLTSPGETGYFHVTGSDAEFVNTNNNRKVKISPDGVYGYNANGDIRFQMDREMVTSAAMGTSNANAYIGTQNGYEVRFVDATQLPSDGLVASYRYSNARGKYGYFDGIAPNLEQDLWLGADGEVRIGNKGFTTYNILRTAGIYADFLEQNTLGNNATNFYIRPSGSGEIRFTSAGSTTSYADARMRTLITESSIVHQSATTTNVYFGTGGSELRVTNNAGYNGGNTSYQDIRYMNAQLLGHIAHHGTGGWFYIGAGGTNGVRFTNNNWTDGGYKNIQYKEAYAHSSELAKYDKEDWNFNVLDRFRNELQLSRFRFNNDENKLLHHGIIVHVDPRKDTFPIEWRRGDSYSTNEVMWWSVKGVQELAHENDELKLRIEKLEEIIYATN